MSPLRPLQAISLVESVIEGADSADAAPLRVGDRVRVRPGVIPSLGWGNVRSTSVGIVVRVDGDRCDVDFPGHPNWHGKVPEVERLISDPVALLTRAIEAAERSGSVHRQVLAEARAKLESMQKTLVETPLLDAMEAVEAADRAASGGSTSATAADASSSASRAGGRGRPWMLEPTVTVSSTDGRHQAANLLDGQLTTYWQSSGQSGQHWIEIASNRPGGQPTRPHPHPITRTRTLTPTLTSWGASSSSSPPPAHRLLLTSSPGFPRASPLRTRFSRTRAPLARSSPLGLAAHRRGSPLPSLLS